MERQACDSDPGSFRYWPAIKLLLGPLLALALATGLSQSTSMHEAAIAVAALALWMAVWWMTEAIPLAGTALLPIVLLPFVDFNNIPPRPGDWLTVRSVDEQGREQWVKARVLPKLSANQEGRIPVAIARESEEQESHEVLLVPSDQTRPWGEVPKTLDRVLIPYADSFIFLFLGGFIVARGIERWNLHRRAAIHVMSAVGSSPARLIAGAMAVTAAMSMWLSNTATTLVMLPVAMSLTDQFRQPSQESSSHPFRGAMALGIAYAATLGGLMTPIGTPPNALLIKELNSRGYEIDFAQWMLFATPLSLAMLLTTWLILTRVVFRVSGERSQTVEGELKEARLSLGRMSRAEWLSGAVFLLVALGWVSRSPLQAAFETILPTVSDWLGRWHDPTIAIAGAVLMFAIPVSLRPWTPLLTWDDAKSIPWDVLLLFGGGLCLSEAIHASGLDQDLGNLLSGLEKVPPWLMIAVIALMITFLTELTSNMATAALFLPLVAVLGQTLEAQGATPGLLMVPTALAASCAFMLPVATPPNALVFAAGNVKIKQMCRAGLMLNLIGVALITAWVATAGRWLLGV